MDTAKQLREVLEACANNTAVSGTEKRMNQNDRNAFKRAIKASLMEVMKEVVGDSADVAVFENEKGIALRLDNEKLGFITVTIDPMIKDLDYDAEFEAEEFVQKQLEAKAKAEERERLKAIKIAKDKELRAKKEELKRLKAEARATKVDEIDD